LFGVIRDPGERPILRAAMASTLVEAPERDRVSTFLGERLVDPGEDVQVRAAAADGLGRLGNPASRPALEGAAHDPAPSVRLAARRALILAPRSTAAERSVLFTAILADVVQPGTARAEAADGLAQLGDRRALPSLLDALREPPPPAPPPVRNPVEGLANVMAARAHVPAAAARALGRLGDPAAIPPLIVQSRSPDTELRIAVFEALVALRATEAVPAARAALTDPAERVRRWAALLLRELDAREALPELRTALGDIDPGVRLQAALALGAMRDSEARGRLEAALETEQFSEVRQALAGALKALP
jgi:HEAT repeat protein